MRREREISKEKIAREDGTKSEGDREGDKEREGKRSRKEG